MEYSPVESLAHLNNKGISLTQLVTREIFLVVCAEKNSNSTYFILIYLTIYNPPDSMAMMQDENKF